MLLKILNNSQKKHLCRNLLFNKVAGGKPETVRSNHWRYSVKQALRNEKILGGYQLCDIVSHHDWPTKKIFHFKSSETALKT